MSISKVPQKLFRPFVFILETAFLFYRHNYILDIIINTIYKLYFQFSRVV